MNEEKEIQLMKEFTDYINDFIRIKLYLFDDGEDKGFDVFQFIINTLMSHMSKHIYCAFIESKEQRNSFIDDLMILSKEIMNEFDEVEKRIIEDDEDK